MVVLMDTRILKLSQVVLILNWNTMYHIVMFDGGVFNKFKLYINNVLDINENFTTPLPINIKELYC